MRSLENNGTKNRIARRAIDMVNTSNAISHAERTGGTQIQSTLFERRLTIKQIPAELQAEIDLDNTPQVLAGLWVFYRS